MEDLLARHRKEQRDLQSQVTQKKKSASKKTRKGVNEECARLEQELKERQNLEIEQLENSTNGSIDHGANYIAEEAQQEDLLDAIAAETSLENDTAGLTISRPLENSESPNGASMDPSTSQQQRKPNRQKARLARRAAEQEAATAAAAEEAIDMPDLKQQEKDGMIDKITKLGLEEKEIAANGHCLYSAVADQMRQLGLDLSAQTTLDSISGANGVASPQDVQPNDYKTVRTVAATYISEHADDFVPFLEEPLDTYLQKIRDTGEWGGQLELLALAKAYSIDINVIQSSGRPEKIEGSNNESRREAWLAYYRHGFGLGEHYNSLRKFQTMNNKGD